MEIFVELEKLRCVVGEICNKVDKKISCMQCRLAFGRLNWHFVIASLTLLKRFNCLSYAKQFSFAICIFDHWIRILKFITVFVCATSAIYRKFEKKIMKIQFFHGFSLQLVPSMRNSWSKLKLRKLWIVNGFFLDQCCHLLEIERNSNY